MEHYKHLITKFLIKEDFKPKPLLPKKHVEFYLEKCRFWFGCKRFVITTDVMLFSIRYVDLITTNNVKMLFHLKNYITDERYRKTLD